MFTKVGTRVLKGLLSLIPIVTILAIFNYLFSISEYLLQALFGFTNNNIVVAIAISLFILSFLYYIGYILEKNREFILLSLTERVIKKIPVVKSIYSIIKETIDIFSNSKDDYKGVVYVPFGNAKVIGFITKEDGEFLTIFVPTTPNPTTGLLFFMRDGDVEHLDMSVEQAVKKLISLGVTK